MKHIKVGNISDINVLRSRVVMVGNLEIALFKISTGEIRAIENSCPHKGGKLSEGIICDHHVFCPLHDWKINLNDGHVEEPDEGCVISYPVDLDEKSGDIFIQIEEKIFNEA
jgi:nitrite reductase (NADH) small subunit